MKIFYCQHDGVYLPGISVVVADDEIRARELLDKKLLDLKLKPSTERAYKLTEITLQESVHMLFDGNY